MFVKPSFKIIDSSLMLVVGSFPGDGYEEADVIWFRDTNGMAFTGSVISPIGRYGYLPNSLDGYRHLSPGEWEAEYKKLGKEGTQRLRNSITEKRDYEAFLKEKENK